MESTFKKINDGSLDDNMVLMWEDVELAYLSKASNPCLYYQIGEPIAKSFLAFAMPKVKLFKYFVISKVILMFQDFNMNH